MKMKLYSMLGILFSFNTFADGFGPALTSQDQPWSVTASFGNGHYQYIHHKDKKSAIGRLALGNELLLAGDYALGLELGLQNGNNIYLKVPMNIQPSLGLQSIETTLSPILDLLITAKSDPLWSSSFFAQFKGGLAYRYWTMHEPTVVDISKLAGEIQAGLGYPITALASLNLLYQGIYGNNPFVSFGAQQPMTRLSQLPPLHAILLGFSVSL